MSDLLKQSFAKAQLSRLPPDVPVMGSFDENEEVEEDDGSSSASSASSTGTIVPSSTKKLFERPVGSFSSRGGRLAPLPWKDFFEQELFLSQQMDDSRVTHHVYLTSPKAGGPLFVTHHGAGSSGLSFAAFTRELRHLLPDAGVLSLDARGHGITIQTPEPDVTDLGLDVLSSDLGYVVKETQKQMNWDSLPDIVLVGHSLGGAVTTDLAKKGSLGSKVLAYAVLDVVEGSALDALQSMETYLSTRPTGFPTLASGIEWHSRSRTIRNQTSARVSVPALLHDISSSPNDSSLSISSDPRPWKWRTDLSATKPFWEDWFTGLSTKFLTAIPGAGKLLLLAGTDRLDKELMIGQMQGKYQLQVFPDAGHFVHEDQPARTAHVMADFWRRNDRGALVLPPKVGQMKS